MKIFINCIFDRLLINTLLLFAAIREHNKNGTLSFEFVADFTDLIALCF